MIRAVVFLRIQQLYRNVGYGGQQRYRRARNPAPDDDKPEDTRETEEKHGDPLASVCDSDEVSWRDPSAASSHTAGTGPGRSLGSI